MLNRSFLVSLAILAAGVAPALAGTSHWTHNSEAEFKKGTLHNVVVTNLGDLKLSRAVKSILEQDPRVSAVYAMAEAPDGTLYVGTGPHGVLLQIKQDKVSDAAVLEDMNIYCLRFDNQNRLLAGTGGEKGRIVRINKAGEKPVEVFSAEGVQYVWSMQQTPDGLLYAATGPNGQLFEIKPDGAKSELFKSGEHNLLSMVSDGKDYLFIGTDPNGLVYRINRKTKEMFVLFDAPESEVTALVLDGKGNLYAATGEASEGAAEKGEKEATDKAGRPEGGATTVPLPSPSPAEPKPPALPDPTPGEPQPIPKSPTTKPLSFVGQASSLSSAVGQASSLSLLDSLEACPRTWFDIEAPTTADTEAHAVPPTSGAKPQPPRGEQPKPPQPPEAQPRAEGNAIYRIDNEGFVREIFRQNTSVLALVEKDGTLLAGTGSEGLIYQVNPAAEETVVLAKVEPKQVMSLLVGRDGRVFVGTANVGGVAMLSSGFAAEGAYTSPVLDATQISRFGKMHLQGSLPPGTALTVAARSGNVNDPSESGWSKWSDELPATEYLQIPSPTARFLQYRVTFTSKEGKESAVVDQVDVAYQMPNMAPQVKGVKVIVGKQNEEGEERGAGKRPKSSRVRTIAWDAGDLNDDALEYTLYFHSGLAGPWILLKDKPKDNTFEWDTLSVADGRYQVKVVASDTRANPAGQGKTGSRVSETFVIDNTPPVIGDMKVKVESNTAHLDARVVDRTSTIASADYAIDSKDEWQAVLPADGIFDSPEETLSFSVQGLTPGPHQITIRATDAFGNHAYESIAVTVK